VCHEDFVADSFQDALNGPAIQLFVIDDEDGILLQDGLRSAEGATGV
jgi:hypothetical protein